MFIHIYNDNEGRCDVKKPFYRNGIIQPQLWFKFS